MAQITVNCGEVISNKIVEIAYVEDAGEGTTVPFYTIDVKLFTDKWNKLTNENFLIQPQSIFAGSSGQGWAAIANETPFIEYDNTTGILNLRLSFYTTITGYVEARAKLLKTKVYMVL